MSDTVSNTVAVLGAGAMGQGIAQTAAQAGFEVVLYDAFPEALAGAEEKLREVLEMLQRKGRLESAVEVLGRLNFTGTLDDLKDASWVIEAVPERLDLKRDLLGKLSAIVPHALLASNTSTLSITALASATSRPQDVLGMHFFNPAPLLKLVEVVPGEETTPGVLERAQAFARALGKEPVVAKDSPGFIVNRVARPFYGEALKLHGEGIPCEIVDRVMRSLGFRMGPFELMDLIGLDVNFAATKSVYNAMFQEPRYRPHPIQKKMVEAGYLGKKTGRGFYRYPRERPAEPLPAVASEQLKAYIAGPQDLRHTFTSAFAHTENADEADLVIDLYDDWIIFEDETREEMDPSDRLILRSVWWASASGLDELFFYEERRPNPKVAGFSVVPPFDKTRLVELYAPLGQENNAAVSVAGKYFEGQGYNTVQLPDTPGGVGFRILAMLINEAVSAVAENLATPEDIDRAMKLGTNYPLGPLEWSELIGLRVVLMGLSGLHTELGEERYRPHPLLKRVVAAGLRSWSELC